eukprot:TRINITY_DN47338_c0_g1_i1.p1 TRINITY_DN47338_c0_g1~~TRINITY_DN47338_c0_g1_i1.p1  ORF type:complete len:698 (-),score=109.66 TRINITY_DN47338_c0_g1_i1:112-2205(-)
MQGAVLSGYRLEKLLGRGASGEVWEASHVSTGGGGRFALKQLDLSGMTAREREAAFQEARLLRKIKHPHIVKFIDQVMVEPRLCIVMQYLDGGDLQREIARHREQARRFQEVDIWVWLLQLASALKYLHKLRILHRDIKPANVFLSADSSSDVGSKKDAVLGDLGIAKVLMHAQGHAVTQIGTPSYLAPEVWLGKHYSYAADIYSLGCTCFELAELRMPFCAINKLLLGVKVCHQPAPKMSAGTDGRTPSLQSLVQSMMDKDPTQRISAADILAYARNLARNRAEVEGQRNSTAVPVRSNAAAEDCPTQRQANSAAGQSKATVSGQAVQGRQAPVIQPSLRRQRRQSPPTREPPAAAPARSPESSPRHNGGEAKPGVGAFCRQRLAAPPAAQPAVPRATPAQQAPALQVAAEQSRSPCRDRRADARPTVDGVHGQQPPFKSRSRSPFGGRRLVPARQDLGPLTPRPPSVPRAAANVVSGPPAVVQATPGSARAPVRRQSVPTSIVSLHCPRQLQPPAAIPSVSPPPAVRITGHDRAGTRQPPEPPQEEACRWGDIVPWRDRVDMSCFQEDLEGLLSGSSEQENDVTAPIALTPLAEDLPVAAVVVQELEDDEVLADTELIGTLILNEEPRERRAVAEAPLSKREEGVLQVPREDDAVGDDESLPALDARLQDADKNELESTMTLLLQALGGKETGAA